MLPLFDTHCDTPRYLFDNRKALNDSDGHVSLVKTKDFSPYIQVAAIWCTFNDTNTAFSTFKNVLHNFGEQCKAASCDIIKTSTELGESIKSQREGKSKAGFIYCVEDCGFITSPEILKEVYDSGVRILIPMWAKTNALGGAHDTSVGLTTLGKEILDSAAKMGFILDISHASAESAAEIMSIAESNASPVIASHSNSYDFYNHSRNLRSEQIKRLVSLGGIIGHSLCPWHLAENGNADVRTVISNLESLISIAGEDNVCFGCDLDGTELPQGFSDASSIAELKQELDSVFSPSLTEKIYLKNAYRKFQQFLK